MLGLFLLVGWKRKLLLVAFFLAPEAVEPSARFLQDVGGQGSIGRRGGSGRVVGHGRCQRPSTRCLQNFIRRTRAERVVAADWLVEHVRRQPWSLQHFVLHIRGLHFCITYSNLGSQASEGTALPSRHNRPFHFTFVLEISSPVIRRPFPSITRRLKIPFF